MNLAPIVVTGAAGLLGRHLCPALAEKVPVCAVVRPGCSPFELKGGTFCPLDLELDDLSALPSQASAVIYLAQSSHFRDFPERAVEIFHLNTVQLHKMLDYARRVGAKNFVYASTGGVYGSPGDVAATENDILPLQSMGFYASSKFCSELCVANYAGWMNTTVLRFFFMYGKGQKRDMLLPRLLDSISSGRSVQLQGQDGFNFNPVSVADGVRAVQACLGLEGHNVINVGGPEVLSLRAVANIIGSAVGREPFFENSPEAIPRHLIGDITKMTQLLGAPTCRLSQGILDLIEVRAH
jgi:UDP-glucose 4-epimerase